MRSLAHFAARLVAAYFFLTFQALWDPRRAMERLQTATREQQRTLEELMQTDDYLKILKEYALHPNRERIEHIQGYARIRFDLNDPADQAVVKSYLETGEIEELLTKELERHCAPARIESVSWNVTIDDGMLVFVVSPDEWAAGWEEGGEDE